MKQLTHVDEAVVCRPVHCIMAFVVTIINDGSRCKQKICQAHVAALDSAQKRSEAKIVSEVNIGAGVQQIERGSNETANGGPVKGRLAVFAALVDGGSSRDQVLRDKRSLRKGQKEAQKERKQEHRDAGVQASTSQKAVILTSMTCK